MKKVWASLVLILTMVFGMCTAASAAGLESFKPVNSFTDGRFSDLSEKHWGYENIATAYSLGLMKGQSDTEFAPDGTLTLAAAITLAARIHSIYNTGAENFVQGAPWYDCYVEYAMDNGLIYQEYADYDRNIERWEFALILGRALPDEVLKVINTVEDGAIPDVPMSASYAPDVYRLYRAGVLTGYGDGSYKPFSNILRAESAALISRMVEPSLRKPVTLVKKDPHELYAPVLEAYAYVVEASLDPDFVWYEDALSVLNSHGYVRYFPQSWKNPVYYAFWDMDGNGVEELFIGTSFGINGEIEAVDVFCHNGEEALHLLPEANNFGATYGRTYVFEDGSLISCQCSNDGLLLWVKGGIAANGVSFAQETNVAGVWNMDYTYYRDVSYTRDFDGYNFVYRVNTSHSREITKTEYDIISKGDTAVNGPRAVLNWKQL